MQITCYLLMLKQENFHVNIKRKLFANYIDQYQIKVYNAILAENINPEGENKFDEILSIA